MKKNILSLILTTILLTNCHQFNGLSNTDFSSMSTEQLIQIIEDPKSDMFSYATEELANRGDKAAEAAPALARALGFPRRDSYGAGIALISMGKAAELAIPFLIPVLSNEQAASRAYASFALGSIGEGSMCAIPEIAPLLWDEEPDVRGAAAITLDALINENLVSDWQKLNPSDLSIPNDTPEGSLTKNARIWWENEGKNIDWKKTSSSCDIPEDISPEGNP